MADRYARNVAGNWADNANWDAVSSAGAGPASYPVAGDTAIFDAGFTGNITVGAAAACAVLTVQAGATGTLTITSGFTLAVSGNITLVAGFVTAGTGSLRANTPSTITTGGIAVTYGNLIINGAVTSNSNGTTWPKISFPGTGTVTITLTSALQCTVLDLTNNYNSSTVFSGAHNITIGTLYALGCPATNSALTFVAGTTVTISTAMSIVKAGSGTYTLQSGTATSAVTFNYGGTPANCNVCGIAITDIDASGSAQVIDNWNGGALLRTTNINNMTSANLARAADASKILTGQTVAGVAGSASAGGGGPVFGGMVVR